MTAALPDRAYAVVDIDGVLADLRHRLHYLERSPKDWDSFFAAARHDALLTEGAAVAERLAADHELVYVTGRPVRLHRSTLAWLRRHGLPDGELRMRRPGDRRPARQVKVEVLRQLARQRRVALLVDDDLEVCAAAARAGFSIFVADWMGHPATLDEAQERDGRA